MSSTVPVVSLLTDFGLVDPYVGVMKAVILARAPGTQIVDITHALPPQDLTRAALFLSHAWCFFPAGSIHLVVVDPGVGTDREILVASGDGHYFVAPDNGVLDPVLSSCTQVSMVRAEPSGESEAVVSATFHGRDIMAPLAGRLAAGASLVELGSPVDTRATLALPQPEIRPGAIVGEVVLLDHFGNLITNITSRDLRDAQVDTSTPIRIGSQTLEGMVGTYGHVQVGALCALIGSSGRLEIALRNANASERLGLGVGAVVQVGPGE